MAEQQKLTVIITGPSGVGKGTVVNALLSDPLLNFLRVPRNTTRIQRPDEKEGVTHCFVSPKTFGQLVSASAFLEQRQVGSHFYGTAVDSYRNALDQSDLALIDVGVSSALQLRTAVEIQDGKALMVFLSPVEKIVLSSDEGLVQALAILEKRIRGRSAILAEELADRLREGKEDLERSHLFTNIVVCKENLIQETVNDIKELILAQGTI